MSRNKKTRWTMQDVLQAELLTDALMPFFLMLVLLTFGNYFGNGGNILGLLKHWAWKLRRGGRKVDGAARQAAEKDSTAGNGQHFIAPVLRAYVWLFSKVERILRQLGADPEVAAEGDPARLDFRIGLSDVLGKRSDLLRLWSYLNLQRLVHGQCGTD